MGNTDLVRTSRDGDQFHYLWAARRALLLLNPCQNLHTITIEGSSQAELDKYISEGEEVIDVGEYYGSDKISKSSKVIYYQLKHSTVHANEPFTPSELEKTFKGFGSRYKELVTSLGEDEIQSKIRFVFVSNRPISSDFLQSIDELNQSGIATKKTNLGKLKRFTGLDDSEILSFLKLLSFCLREESYLNQRSILNQEIQYYLPGADYQAPIQLKELITQKATSKNGKHPEITKTDVLRAINTNEESLFPVRNLIKKLDAPIIRSQFQQLIDDILGSKDCTFVIQADGGVGKSILSSQIQSYLPENSIYCVYDCFGDGDYRRSSSARHTHKVALVQMANELASQGLCHPLIPSLNADSKDYIKAFLYRLKQASEKIQQQNSLAYLVLAIDAADNAQMAADEFNDGRSFIVDLLKELFPPNVKVIALCRPYRVCLLDLPPKTTILTLDGFNLDETRLHLEKFYPKYTNEDVSEFQRLTSNNPRVQSIALGKRLSLQEMLAFFGGSPKGVDDTIRDLLSDSIAKIKEFNYFDAEKIDSLCQSIAVLRPLIPIAVLAQVSQISEDQIRSIISDIGGHPIRLNNNYIQFVDEPTESWFRENYKPKTQPEIRTYIEKLKPLANSSGYVASVLPQLLLDAELFHELVDMALNSELLPSTSPLERRNIELQRLQFAIKAGIKIKKYAEVAKLTLKAGGEASAKNRQNKLLQNNIELLPSIFDSNQIQELIADGTFEGGSWRGSNYAYEAKLLSYNKELKDEARSKLRIGEEWLSNLFKQPKDERHGQDVEYEDITCFFIAHLNIHGAIQSVKWLRTWTPKSVSYHVGVRAAQELILIGQCELIQEIIDASSNNIFLILGIVEVCSQYRIKISIPQTRRVLGLLSHRLVVLDLRLQDYKETILRPIVSFLTIAYKNGECSADLAHTILVRYLPDDPPYSLRERYIHQDRTSILKAYALEKAWSDSELKLVDLVPERLKEQFLNGNTYGESRSDIESITKITGALLPWHTLYARCVTSKFDSSTLSQFIESAKELSKKAIGYSYSEEGYHLQNEIAKLWFEILLIHDELSHTSFNQISAYFGEEKLYPYTLNYFTYIFSLHPSLNFEDFAYKYTEICFSSAVKSQDHAETILDDIVQTVKSIFPLDKRQACLNLNKAMEISNKTGDENIQRWDALVYYAEKTGEVNAHRAQLAYKFSRCAELTYQYVDRDKHFLWDATVSALYLLDKNSAIAIASRWRDRGFGDNERVLNGLVESLLADDFSPLALLTLAALGGAEHISSIMSSITRLNLNTVQKIKVLDVLLKYIVTEEPTKGHFNLIKLVYTNFNVAHKEIESLLNEPEKYFTLKEEKYHSSNYNTEDKNIDWNFFFEDCTDENGIDAEKADVKFKKLEKHYFLGVDYYQQILTRLSSPQVYDFLDVFFNNPKNDQSSLANLLNGLPENLLKRCGVKDALGEHLKIFCIKNASNIYLYRYYNSLPLELLEKVSNISKSEYVECLLDGIAINMPLLDSEKLFNISSLLSQKITPQEASNVLEYGLSLLECELVDGNADGDWGDHLAPPTALNSTLAGYIWTGLASPFMPIRWQATHVVRLLLELEQHDLITELLKFAQGQSCSAFIDNRYKFYNLSALQFLLIAMLRVSKESPKILLPYVSFFKALTIPSKPHLIIRLFAAKILLSMQSHNNLNQDEIDFYQKIGQSPFEKISDEHVDQSEYSTITDIKHYSFGVDFGPYWLKPVGSLFGLNAKQIYYETTKSLIDILGYEPDGHVFDKRSSTKVYDWEMTSHSHGSAPRAEDLDFYLCYHSMMITVDNLLQSRALVVSPYSTREFDEWISRFDLSAFDGHWLSEYRDLTPKISSEWANDNSTYANNWTNIISVQDFNDGLNFDEKYLTLWGYWSEVQEHDKAKDFNIRSSLVSPKTSSALWRALQATDNSHDYCLPKANEDYFEIENGIFKLKGWIDEDEGFDDSLFENDTFSASLNCKKLRPSRAVEEIMALKSDALEKQWFNQSGNLVVQALYWGTFKHERTEYNNGNKLIVSKRFINNLLNKMDMDLIITVGVKHRLKYGSFSRDQETGLGYVPNSQRIYLIKKNGEMHVY